MQFDSGFGVYKTNRGRKAISSGDDTLDELLNGGFQRDLVHLLYGDEKKATQVLLRTGVIAQQPVNRGGLGEGIRAAFVDGNNKFNPYTVSKFAVSKKLSPQKVLENILIARAFTWDQMVELLQNRLAKLEDIKVILISGITDLFQSYEKQTFEDLLRAINGIKKVLSREDIILVLTGKLHENSRFRPKGGKILSHFGQVLVLIRNEDRFYDYVLAQHPFLPEKRERKWKPRKPKRNLANTSNNTTLDFWME